MIDPRTTRRRVTVLAVAASTALVLAGCRLPGRTPPPTGGPTTAVPPTSAPATTVPTTAPPTTTPSGGPVDPHCKGGAPSNVPLTGGGQSDHHGMPERLNHPPTEAQKAAAQRLIDETKEGAAHPDPAQFGLAPGAFTADGFFDVENAKKAGYASIGDEMTGVAHFDQPDFHHDGCELDPKRIETLVYKVEGEKRTLITTMYTMEPGTTMDSVPDIAGNLTMWHDHQNLCFGGNGFKLEGIFVNGKCTPGGTLVQTPPMLHVWVTDNPCGPFAGVDAGQRTGSCTHDM